MQQQQDRKRQRTCRRLRLRTRTIAAAIRTIAGHPMEGHATKRSWQATLTETSILTGRRNPAKVAGSAAWRTGVDRRTLGSRSPERPGPVPFKT